jgi:tRNA-2-methylthio-N6-dimethylallyladenosine synthase
VRHAKFAHAFSFKYSPRPGTPAAKLDGQVPEKVKSERLARLQDLLDSQMTVFNSACVGRTLPVLVERSGRRTSQLVGRSPYLQSVQIEAASENIGRILPVEIVAAGPHSLTGVISPSAVRC